MAKATTNPVKDAKPRSKRSRRKNRFLPYILGGVGVLLLIFLPIIVNSLRSGGLPGESFASQGNTHIQLGDAHPPYNSDPPTSGWHTGDLIAWGSYDYVVPDERVIHNMEDGGVILWYRLGAPEENEDHIEALEEISSRFRRIVILPREGMPTAYAFTAWQRLQRFDEINEEGMLAFIDAFEGIDHHARF
ncbi:MAG: DUF3105 domain-containing protein [Trueperaceae bacterium]|nr:MAG: DUF3105 domain-containing protein [Trueperaceae bacterium]